MGFHPTEEAPIPQCDAQVICADCGSPMQLRRGRHGLFWGCTRWPKCKGVHSAHQETGAPLGIPADRPTIEMRKKAHASFDRIWKQGLQLRAECYRWLRRELGMSKDDCHIGKFTQAQCANVIELADERYWKLLRRRCWRLGINYEYVHKLDSLDKPQQVKAYEHWLAKWRFNHEKDWKPTDDAMFHEGSVAIDLLDDALDADIRDEDL